jgi:hypothetical protein
VVAFGVFMIAWSARRFLENDYLLFVGTAFVFVAGVDGVHTLAYRNLKARPTVCAPFDRDRRA